jgi:Domain of unknown function (DUF4203)
MFFQTVLVSLLLILLGLAMTFAGYRFFVILLPIWGFFAGFQFGATIFTNIFGEGFLRTVLSWVVGLLVAIFAAVLAYLFYAVAVVLLAGFVGYQLGVGIMTWIGLQEGFLTFLVGLVFALGIAALAIFLRLPKLLIIVLSAFAGAGTILAGIFLAVGRISIDSLRYGEVGAILRDNWLWGLLYLAIAAIGFYFQWRTTQSFIVEEYSTENVFASAGTGATVDAAPSATEPDLTPPSSVTPAADLPPTTA